MKLQLVRSLFFNFNSFVAGDLTKKCALRRFSLLVLSVLNVL